MTTDNTKILRLNETDLWDEFAQEALAGILSNPNVPVHQKDPPEWSNARLVGMAYGIADAMLSERNRLLEESAKREVEGDNFMKEAAQRGELRCDCAPACGPICPACVKAGCVFGEECRVSAEIKATMQTLKQKDPAMG